MNQPIKDIKSLKAKILPILQTYQVTKAGVFGSLAQNNLKPTSDIDILVEIQKDISLLDFIDLKFKLESVLHRPVDLVEYDTIKPALKQRILNEEIQIL